MSVARSDDPDMFVWPPFCSNIAFELWSARPEDAPDKVNRFIEETNRFIAPRGRPRQGKKEEEGDI